MYLHENSASPPQADPPGQAQHSPSGSGQSVQLQKQESAAAGLGEGEAFEQVRLVLQQLLGVQRSTVLAALPRDFARLKLRLCGFAHGLLNGLLELGFELGSVSDLGTDRD